MTAPNSVTATANLTSKDFILHRVRTGLGRSAGQAPPLPPPVRLVIEKTSPEERLRSFTERVEALAGTVHHAASAEEAKQLVAVRIAGKTAIASNASFLAECGIAALPEVRSGVTTAEEVRSLCATADFGITSADYALADTGTLVMISSQQEARFISLLPPAHIAVVPQAKLLANLDELFTRLPNPSAVTSSMVLITGPSRTADIEQILVRGVHGPGDFTVIVVA
jgi:L-lactate dehydrogenase complex protein LldG